MGSETDPDPVKEQAVLDYQRLYEYRFREIDQSARAEVWSRIAPFIWRKMGSPEVILDPAAGRREFLLSIPATERWAVDEVEYDEAGEDDGITQVTASIMEAQLPQDHFEGIFVSNFLEHLPSQEGIFEFLIRMRDAMKPGGSIAVLGPNYRYASKDYWDCADHYVALTDGAVAEHLYTAGFEPEVRIPKFLPYSFRGRLPASPALTDLYLRTPPLWKVLGKQFLVIGRT